VVDVPVGGDPPKAADDAFEAHYVREHRENKEAAA
jgi:hypothetical protein